MKEIVVKPGAEIALGKRGENLARVAVFDISGWRKTYGEGRVHLLHQRNGDKTPYPCVVETDGDMVRWELTDTDVDVAGRGRAELQYFVGEARVKSEMWITRTDRSLNNEGPVPEGPGENWLDTMLKLSGNTHVYAEEAREAVEEAQRMAAEATEEARKATESALKAAASATDSNKAWGDLITEVAVVEEEIIPKRNVSFAYEDVFTRGMYVGTTTALSIPRTGESYVVEIGESKSVLTKKEYLVNELNHYHYLGNLGIILKGVEGMDSGESVLVLWSDDAEDVSLVTAEEGSIHLCHVYKGGTITTLKDELLEGTVLASDMQRTSQSVTALGEQVDELDEQVTELMQNTGLSDRVKALEEWVANKDYVNISVSASHNRTGAVEKGTVFNDVTVSWSVTRAPTALTISGNGITGTESLTLAKSGSKKITGLNINADNASSFSWTVKATGEKATDIATAKASGFNFRTRVYYGAADLPATINSDFVKSLIASGLVSSKVKSIEVNGGGKYIWYCLPVGGTGMGKCSFMSNNFPFDMQEPQTVSVTNDKGYTENYYVYRSTNQIDVTMKIEVS